MTAEERAALITQYAAGYDEVIRALVGISTGKLTAHPIAGKWSAAEIVHHLGDSEMTSAIRLRRLLCENNPLIPGYDEAFFARRLDYNNRDIAPALEAFHAARATTMQLLRKMTAEDWLREGVHSESGHYTAEDWLRSYGAHAHDHAAQIRRLAEALPRDEGLSRRPGEGDYLPDFGGYISLVPNGNVVQMLETQLGVTLDLLAGLNEAQAKFRYAPDKWSIKELVGHLIDGERVFAYRALRFARNDKTPLPGFEQDDFIAAANFDAIPLAELTSEFADVRHASVKMLRNLSEEAWDRRGVANGHEMTTRAAAFVIAGHELHHRKVLRERYLAAL